MFVCVGCLTPGPSPHEHSKLAKQRRGERGALCFKFTESLYHFVDAESDDYFAQYKG